MLTLITLLVGLAHAEDVPYATCCNEAGAFSCPDRVEVVGPESVVTPTGVTGLWVLTCSDGASYFPYAHREASGARTGDVVTHLDRAAAACFDAACPLPTDVCLDLSPTGQLRAVRCDDGGAADEDALASMPMPRQAVVASSGRVVRVERMSVADARVQADARTSAREAVATEAVMAVQRPVPSQPPAPVRPTPAEAFDDGTPPGPPIDWSIPALPPDPCVPARERVDASNDQVELGDDAMVGGRMDEAMAHYRAAVQVNACNGYAWDNMGAALLDAGYASRARDALQTAVRLSPRNVRAWVDLAHAFEMLGSKGDAIDAYHEALEVRPGYLPAEEGLRQVVRR